MSETLLIIIFALVVLNVERWLRLGTVRHQRDTLQSRLDMTRPEIRILKGQRDCYFESSRRWKERALALMGEKANAWKNEKI